MNTHNVMTRFFMTINLSSGFFVGQVKDTFTCPTKNPLVPDKH